jgi:ribosomal protein S18 acetylase RimI-like enzyme
MSTIEANDHVFLSGIRLLPEYRSRGIGSGLIGRELAYPKSLGKPAALVRPARQPSERALYERLGFRVTGETEHHFVMISGCAPFEGRPPRLQKAV